MSQEVKEPKTFGPTRPGLKKQSAFPKSVRFFYKVRTSLVIQE